MHVDVDCQMLELLGESAPGALHRDGPSLHRSLDTLRHLDRLKGVDFLHDFSCRSESSNKSLVRVPLAPFTVTALAFTEASMPSGTSISSKELISFMTSLVEVNQAIKAWSF